MESRFPRVPPSWMHDGIRKRPPPAHRQAKTDFGGKFRAGKHAGIRRRGFSAENDVMGERVIKARLVLDCAPLSGRLLDYHIQRIKKNAAAYARIRSKEPHSPRKWLGFIKKKKSASILSASAPASAAVDSIPTTVFISGRPKKKKSIRIWEAV